MNQHFVSRGYNEKHLENTLSEVRKLTRDDLLIGKDESTKIRDPQSVFVCTWHPKLKCLPSILNQNHAILNADPKLNKVFPTRSTVAFRRKKNLANHLCRNDIRARSTNKKEEKCKGCIICKQVKDVEFVINNKSGAQVETKPGATCRTKGVVYAVRCIYVGHTGDSINIRFCMSI